LILLRKGAFQGERAFVVLPPKILESSSLIQKNNPKVM